MFLQQGASKAKNLEGIFHPSMSDNEQEGGENVQQVEEEEEEEEAGPGIDALLGGDLPVCCFRGCAVFASRSLLACVTVHW